MAKSRNSGFQNTPPTNTAADDATQRETTPSGYTLADVQAMDDKQTHDFLISVNDIDTPDFLNKDLHTQKMVYGLGLNDKPKIISQQEFDDETVNVPFGDARVLYRTVDDAITTGGVKMTAEQQLQMLAYGDLSWIGRGIHGDGLYFSNSESGSKSYGSGRGKSATIACVLNENARMITERNLKKEYDQYVKSHPETRKALGFARSKSTNDSYSQFALLRGYNVIVSSQFGGEAYYTVLDRKALSTTGKIEKW